MTKFTKSKIKYALLYFQEDDECAKEIKLSYPGYNSSYSSVSNIPIVYELLLKQGVTYNLIIYLKLSDGAEIIFWRQRYTTFSGNIFYYSGYITVDGLYI